MHQPLQNSGSLWPLLVSASWVQLIVSADHGPQPRALPALQAAAAAASRRVQELQDKLDKAQAGQAALQAKVLHSSAAVASCSLPTAHNRLPTHLFVSAPVSDLSALHFCGPCIPHACNHCTPTSSS